MRKIIQIMSADGWYAQIMNNGQEGLNTVEKILYFALIEDDNKTCVETYVGSLGISVTHISYITQSNKE